ncbi:MAG: potassium channel family protein, partial [Pseudomonadota bacterium]
QRGHVTADLLFGAAAVYLMGGIAFGVAHHLVETLHPGSFVGLPDTAEPPQMLYFSLVTLTTLGFGDVAPVFGPARALVVLEALFGQLYVAIMLARLVALQVSATPGARGE